MSSAVGRGSDDASSELVSMNHDGEDVRTHASSPLATVIRMSPAGKHVAYREAGRLYVAALPMTGRSITYQLLRIRPQALPPMPQSV